MICKRRGNDLQNVARREPNNAGVLNNLATVEVLAGDHASAIKHFRAALAADPTVLGPKNNLTRLVDLVARQVLVIPAASLTAYQELVARAAGGQGPMPFNRVGWLYVIPGEKAASDPTLNDASISAKLLQLNLGGALGPNWVADNSCPACRGQGMRPCPNPECRRGTVVKTIRAPVAPNGAGGAVMGTRKVYETCPICHGENQVECQLCHGTGHEWGLP